MESINQIEAGWLLWIQENIRTEIFDVIMPFFSEINNSGMIAIIAVVVLLLLKITRSTGVIAFWSLLMEYIIVNVGLKPIVMRTRPYVVNEALELLGEMPTDYSFPSGHTGSAFAVAWVCFLCLPKRYGVTAVVIAALIAFSRLYNAAHYPTDVLAATVIAFITAGVAKWLVNRFMIKSK